MVANAGKISVEFEGRLDGLAASERAAEQKVAETTARLNELSKFNPFSSEVGAERMKEWEAGVRATLARSVQEAKTAGDDIKRNGPFGDSFTEAIAGKLARGLFGLGAIRGGIETITAAVHIMRGDTEKAWEAIQRFPILGPIIGSVRELSDALADTAGNAQRLREQFESRLNIATQMRSAQEQVEQIRGAALGPDADLLGRMNQARARAAEASDEGVRREELRLADALQAQIAQRELQRAEEFNERAARQQKEQQDREVEGARSAAEAKRRIMDEDRRKAEQSIRETERQRQEHEDKAKRQAEELSRATATAMQIAPTIMRDAQRAADKRAEAAATAMQIAPAIMKKEEERAQGVIRILADAEAMILQAQGKEFDARRREIAGRYAQLIAETKDQETKLALEKKRAAELEVVGFEEKEKQRRQRGEELREREERRHRGAIEGIESEPRFGQASERIASRTAFLAPGAIRQGRDAVLEENRKHTLLLQRIADFVKGDRAVLSVAR